jgi:hypothetical protein
MRRRIKMSLALAVCLTMSVVASVSLSGSADAASGGHAAHVMFRGKASPFRAQTEKVNGSRLGPLHLTDRVEANMDLQDNLEELEGEEGEETEFPAPGPLPKATELATDLSATDVLTSWEGENSFHNVWSSNGNQFDLEPPDQGLCVGNGFVFETVNSVIQVYDEQGTPLITGNPFFPEGPPVGLSLNEFYGFPPPINFETGEFGPFTGDVTCYYDQETGHWFHAMFAIEQDPETGAFTGNSTTEIAVSATADPLGAWFFYSIPGQNNGTDGTPDHQCDLGFCFGDFPHIGADANGFYLTTNEYSFFGNDYNGAQLYAFSKADLIAGDPAPTLVYLENLDVPELGQPSFTVWPAQSRAGEFETSNGGVEYLVSSTAGDGFETGNTTGRSDKMVVWALANTESLGTDTPSLSLSRAIVTTLEYVFPPKSFMRQSGPTPILDCINLGTTCPAFALPDPPFVQEGPYPLDSSDTRVLSSYFQDGVLWTTLGTAVKGAGGSSYDEEDQFAPELLRDRKAGIAYFAFQPSWSGAVLGADVVQQGVLGGKRTNLIYPSFAMGDGDVGFIGATRVGPDHFASPVYIRVQLGAQPATMGVIVRGVGPNDGFTGTWVGDFRPRWGDYGYAAPGDDGTVWVAAEYTASRCSLAQFAADITCGFRRGIFENWSTRIAQLQA